MIDMKETKLQTLAQLQSFLAGAHDIALSVTPSQSIMTLMEGMQDLPHPGVLAFYGDHVSIIGIPS